MATYSLRYISGPNDRLKISEPFSVRADSFEEALSKFTPWPVEEMYDHSSACARNPGTSLYDFEAWEVHPVADTERPCALLHAQNMTGEHN